MKAPISKLFEETFGHAAAVTVRAPGRVEVLGNHTDYNEGFVLSCAIDKNVYAAASVAPDATTCEFVSMQYPDVVRIGDVERRTDVRWIRYPLGVYTVLKHCGYPVQPFRIAFDSDIPQGNGLSSSAALEVATATCLCALFNLVIEPVELAKICQRAENEYVGANSGLLDQFSSLFGRRNELLYIDFRTLSYRTFPLPSDELCLAITSSGVTHTLAESAYNERRRHCEAAADYFGSINPDVRTLRDVSMAMLDEQESKLEPDIYRRARHVVGENERVLAGATMIENGDLAGFGRLLYRSHESSLLNFENSCPELDTLVSIARSIDGVYGARLTGGGFGGSTLTLLNVSVRDTFERTMVEQYKRESGLDTVVHFATIADGADLIQ